MRFGTHTLTGIRPLRSEDAASIEAILRETGVFTSEEIEVGMELVATVLDHPGQRDYEISCSVDEGDQVIGYACFGPTPMTAGTFDLYWIAVKPALHNRGVGTELLRCTEETIAARGGHLIVAETSSKPSYAGTRAFYLRNRYAQVARIRNYYNTEDDLVVYGKYLSPSGGT